MFEPLANPIWAPDAADRRLPTSAEIANGLECGPVDRKLFNEIYRRALWSQAELSYAIEKARMVLDPTDIYQTGEAILRMHRIPENQTFIVGPSAEFETLQDVMEYLSPMAIPVGVAVTIQLLDHNYRLDSTTGHWAASHPFGHRIEIKGQPLTGGGWPTAVAVRNPNPAYVDGVLRARFPTVIECFGVSGIFLMSHDIALVENVLFIGDRTGGTQLAGVRVGERLTMDAGRGTIRLNQVWAHGFAGHGILARYQSAITGFRVGASHNSVDGFRSANQSSINLNYGVISSYNGQHGLHCLDQAEMQMGPQDGFGEASIIEFNGGNGLNTRSNSNHRMFLCHFLNHTGNKGINASLSASGVTENCTFTGNNQDINASDGANLKNSLSTPATPSMSPAANTVGNSNAYIAHS